MSTVSELISQGVAKMRLPDWQVAYLVPNETGPWAKVYDAGAGIDGGEPNSILISVCDTDNRWVPA